MMELLNPLLWFNNKRQRKSSTELDLTVIYVRVASAILQQSHKNHPIICHTYNTAADHLSHQDTGTFNCNSCLYLPNVVTTQS